MLLPLYKNVIQNENDGSGSSKLVSDLDPELLDRITGRYHPYFTNEQVNKVKYLSISRTSNLHRCKPLFQFSFPFTIQEAFPLANNFLGLVLLDEDLQSIEGSDVVINVDKWLLGNMTAFFHDFQIVAVRTRASTSASEESSKASESSKLPLKDQLFVFSSGPIGTFGIPIDIRRVPPRGHHDDIHISSSYSPITWNTPLRGQKYKTVPFSPELGFMYGDGFEVRFLVDTNTTSSIQMKNPKARGDIFFDTGAGIDRGKNLHFFEDVHGKTYMELWPHGTHRTVPVNFIPDVNVNVRGEIPIGETNNNTNTNTNIDTATNTYTNTATEDSSSSSSSSSSSPRVVMFPKKYMGYIDEHKQYGRKDVIYPDMIEASSNEEGQKQEQEPKVQVSFKHENERPKKKRFRGTSQIIDMVLEGKDVKVGISHTIEDAEQQVKVNMSMNMSMNMNINITDTNTDKQKRAKERVYLSQFYAFEPEPPFEVVATSAHFCLNHMSENDIGYAEQWISERPVSNRTAPIIIETNTKSNSANTNTNTHGSFRCPMITFATGLNEMIGYNGENVVITYGVDDCYSRSLIVPKKKIEMLLLGKLELKF